jgi:hypothetical protein
MITTILRSAKFGKAACALFIGGTLSIPFAVLRDCEMGDKNLSRAWCATGAAGLGVIGEYAAIIAHFI